MNSISKKRLERFHCAAVAAGLSVLLAAQIGAAWALSGLLMN